jgi:hypothetical protein
VVLDVQGYFTNMQILPPATGPRLEQSGNRPATGMITRSLTDRVTAGINPVNGNLLLTQNLLNLTGIGQGVNINVRYNSLGDARPTLNVGLFEAQLFARGNGEVTYTAADGGGYTFTSPTAAGGGITRYTVPTGLNAHLTRYQVAGQPDRYEVVFHPGQVTLIYHDTGSNLRLDQAQDVTGSNTISYTYSSNGSQLSSITDTQGRVVTARSGGGCGPAPGWSVGGG